MCEVVLGADPRHAVDVELDAVADAELFGVEGAVLGGGVPLAEECSKPAGEMISMIRQGSSPAFRRCATGRGA
jgi:hypothetical protein